MGQSEYWDKFMRERLSRRKVLKGGLMAGAGLLTASTIGCGSSPAKPSGSTTPASGAAPTPASGASPAPVVKRPTGTFTSSGGSPKGVVLDPHQQQHTLSTWIQYTDELVFADDTGPTNKGLATSWTVAPDGLSWTFKLRKGVLFHDETEFTAEDVKFSFDRQMRITTSAAQPILADYYDHTEIIDPYTVKIVLKKPQMALDVHNQTIARILPKKYIEKVGDDYFLEHPIGSGPWKIAKWEPGTRMEFEAFEKHFLRVPKFQKHISLALPDRATQLAMLQAGELDVASGMLIEELDQVKAISGMYVYSKPGWSNQGMYAFTDDGPGKVWKDERVRKAFMYSFNREKLAKTWGQGLASPAVNMTYPYTFGYNPNLKPWPFDAAKAKQLLTEAGYPNGIELSIYVHGSAKAECDAAAIVLNEVGLFRVRQVVLTLDWLKIMQYKQIVVKDHTFIVFGAIGSLYAYAGDAGYIADVYWAKTAMYSFPVGDEKFEDMVVAARTITDVEKRRKFLQDMLAYMHEKQFFPMMLNTPYLAALGPKIKPSWDTYGQLNPWYWNIEPK